MWTRLQWAAEAARSLPSVALLCAPLGPACGSRARRALAADGAAVQGDAVRVLLHGAVLRANAHSPCEPCTMPDPQVSGKLGQAQLFRFEEGGWWAW